MARRKAEPVEDTRDAAAKQLAEAEAATAAALTAKHDAAIAALDAHIAQVNEPFVGSSLTIKGNQGR